MNPMVVFPHEPTDHYLVLFGHGLRGICNTPQSLSNEPLLTQREAFLVANALSQ